MAERIVIGKEYTFDAAHKLPFHEGKCKRLHGHTYKVDIAISGPIQSEVGENSSAGMVLDYERLDFFMTPFINLVDHTYLNDVGKTSGLENSGLLCTPTAENISLWFYKGLNWTFSKADAYTAALVVERVTVREGEKTFATVLREELVEVRHVHLPPAFAR